MCNGISMIAAGGLERGPGFLRGARINRMCATLASPEARREFYFGEAAYCLRFGLNRQEREAVEDRDFVTLIGLGAHVRELDKLAALSGLNTLEAIRKRRGDSKAQLFNLWRADT